MENNLDNHILIMKSSIDTNNPWNLPLKLWILQVTGYLIYQCAAGSRETGRDQLRLHRLEQRIKDTLMENRAQRETLVGGEIESLLFITPLFQYKYGQV